MSVLDKTFPVIHVLRGGFPLCGFSLALPEKWPPGHKWVPFQDPEARRKTSCPDCKAELEGDN